MTIKSNGGVFGRNPEFQTVTVQGDLKLTTALQFVGGARLTSTSTNLVVDKNMTVNGLRLGRANGSTSDTNTAFGLAAIPATTYTGTNSTAVGWGAMFSSTGNSYYNTATGSGALFSNTSGYVNTAVGGDAGRDNTSGANNTFVGGSAGGITTGSNNIVIGAGATASATTVSNETTIGNSSTTKARIFGDIVLVSGRGIDFSATAGTGTSELFDDYEEGTVSSPLRVGGTLVTSGYALNLTSYTKVGNMSLVNINFDYTSPAGTGPSGDVTLALPFVPRNSVIIPTSVYMSVAIPSLGIAYVFIENNDGNAKLTQANVNNVYSLAQGERISVRASITYQTD